LLQSLRVQEEAGVETMHCVRCGTRVTAQAPRCPECGADPQTGFATLKRGEPERVRVCQGVRIRSLALAIDCVVVALAWLAVALVYYLALVGTGKFSVVGKEPTARPVWVVGVAGVFVYFWLCEAVWGRTLGKRLCDLRVVRRDGGRLGAGGALVRNVLRLVDWLPAFFLLGAVVIWVTPADQRLGDLAAASAVVRVRRYVTGDPQSAGRRIVPWSAGQG
jgi:uncharacterized RDD family membrane protein YckC